jgi:hypothetical protein
MPNKMMTDKDKDNLPPDIIITYREGDKIYRKELVIIEKDNSPPDFIITIAEWDET